MRIAQLLPALAYGDAVGNDALAIDRILKEDGADTMICSDRVDARIPAGTAQPVSALESLTDGDLLIYHFCTGAPMNFDLPKWKGRKVMVYHNITPAKYFRGVNPEIERIQKDAEEGFRFLRDKVDLCIADSEYNKTDLIEAGYTCPARVCPILIPYEDYRREPDEGVLKRYGGDGVTNLLFVGRVAPNKKQEDIVRAFAMYREKYNPDSRLILAGSSGGLEKYAQRLRAYIDALGLTDRVIFPGHVRFSEILAWYRLADVFVCMSEHEGFCVPIVEAMLFGTPIVARKAAAVPDTLGSGGLLTEDADPRIAAAAIHRLVTDGELRDALKKEQEKTLARFSPERTRAILLDCLKPYREA